MERIENEDEEIREIKLKEWLRLERKKVSDAGREFFLGLPVEWYEPQPTYCCVNGHISNAYLNSEERGALCLACNENLWLCPAIEEEDFKKIIGL